MTAESVQRGLLDTNIMILRSWIAPDELPDEMAISAVTLGGGSSAGPHEVRPDAEQDFYFEAAERAGRLDVLQRAEHEFDPIPFDANAARAYGRVTAAVIAAGRKPRRRVVDLMIAATAIAAELPLYTANPDDFAGLSHLVTVIPVTRPEVPNERQAARQERQEHLAYIPAAQRLSGGWRHLHGLPAALGTPLLGAASGGGAAGVGYPLEDRVADVGEFVEALSRAAGGTALDPEVVTQLLGASRRTDGLGSLTARERDVLALMAEGRSNGAIAGILVVSERAVEKHVGNIFSKLGLAPSDADHRRVLAVLRYLES